VRTIVLTGATDGLGRALIPKLAAPGVRLILSGRSADRGAEAVADAQGRGARASFVAADLASLAEVDRLAAAVLAESDSLQMLINNAGIGFGGPQGVREVSADGHELRFAVNYLAPVRLTERLLPALIAGAPSQIVNVASIGQHPLEFDDLMLTRAYSGSRAYRQAKLAMIMWTFDLADRLKDKGVTANALHPATFMDTTMVRQGGGAPLSTVAEGVEAVMKVIADGATVSGAYYDGQQPSRANEQAYDQAARRRLREATDALLT